MNKELKALEVSKQLKGFVLEFVKNGLDRMFINGSFETIETALTALETLRNALIISYKETPMSVTRDENGVTINSEVSLDFTRNAIDEEYIKALRQWVLENACPKEVEALKIIKEKGVEVGFLKDCKILKAYNESRDVPWSKELTQDEFDFLKGVIGDE